MDHTTFWEWVQCALAVLITLALAYGYSCARWLRKMDEEDNRDE